MRALPFPPFALARIAAEESPETRLPEAPPGEPPPPDDADGGNDGRDPNNDPRWVTVATFSLSTQAHLARLRLEAEDIDCVLIDEHLIATNWLLSPAIGGIKLQVPRDQATRAREILGAQATPWDESQALELARCSHCGQGDYVLVPVPRWAFLLSLALLGIPLLFLPRRWACESCHSPLGS